MPSKDERGEHEYQVNKNSEDDTEHMKALINPIPRYEFYYNRSSIYKHI